MSKQILIELVGENETGYCYADVYLPASAEEIAEAKERANWNSASNGIRDIESHSSVHLILKDGARIVVRF